MKLLHKLAAGVLVGGAAAALLMLPGQAPAPVEAGPPARAAQEGRPLFAPVAGNAAPARARAHAAAQASPVSIYSVEKAVAEARARGATEAEVYRIRTRGLPAQTIAMLAEREQAEKAWAQRLQAWREARAKLAPNDEAGIKRLREQLFNPEEQALLASSEPNETPQLVLH